MPWMRRSEKRSTPEMALEGSIDPGVYLVCTEIPTDGSCPDYSELGDDFILETLGHPWGDRFCWYHADPVCGPETAITDRCCYELEGWMIACA